jgi:hypothetical protein
MRNFFAAMTLVIFGAAGSLQLKTEAPTPPTSSPGGDQAKPSDGGCPKPDSGYPKDLIDQATTVLIATVPDPKLTRHALHFDRWVESLQRGAEAADYQLQKQWMPWRSAEETVYRKPGILLFSRTVPQPETLVIMLVGESPAAGVFPEQLKEALSDAGSKLKGIVGPAFSGGFDSLAKVLTPFSALPIVSGSATNQEAAMGFIDKCFMFSSTVDTDQNADKLFRSYLESRSVLESRPVICPTRKVTLSEGGTRYASGKGLIFPRDISLLRRAYDSDSQLRKSISSANENILSNGAVPLPRNEESAGRDYVPTQAPVTSAASQELAMQAIARNLRETRKRLAEVRATSTMDLIFLRQYFAKAAPDVPFVILEPDLLFTHIPEVYAFQGTLSVSRYPLRLLPESDRIFPSKAAEGVYWATLQLLDPSSRGNPTRPTDLMLSIIGLDGYWPVANLNQQQYVPPHKAEPKGKPFSERPPKGFVALWLLFGVALALAFAATREGRKPHESGPRTWYADFFYDADAPIGYSRVYHGYCVLLGLSALFIVLARPLESVWGFWIYIPALAALAAAAKALQIALLAWNTDPNEEHSHWIDKDDEGQNRKSTLWLILVTTLLIALFVASLYAATWRGNDFGWSYFAAYRSLYLTNGVNPLLPIVLAGSSILFCAWCHFQRSIFASERFVPLAFGEDQTLAGPYDWTRNVLGGYGTRASLTLAAIAALFVIAIALSYGSALSIEGSLYDIYIVTLLAVSSGLTMLSVTMFLQSWWHFSSFLRGLETLPLRHVFSRMPPSMGTTALFRTNPRQRSYLYLIRARDCLRKYQKLDPQGVARVPPEKVQRIETAISALETAAGADKRESAKEAIEAQLSLCDVNATLIAYLQSAVWNKGESMEDGAGSPKEKEKEKEKKDEPDGRIRALAEEFIALRFLGFIRYVVLQLRNLLTLFSVSFILQAMAVSCYPFFSQTLTQLYLLSAFAILSLAVGYVLLQMSRDPILLRLSTDPATGASKEHPILQQALQSASLPMLAFASTYFPDLGRMLLNWVGPLSSLGGK